MDHLMPSSVTMQDIANAADVSKTTVSLALRDDPRLREITRQRIQKIALEMGYRINPVISSLLALREKRTLQEFRNTIGLVNASGKGEMLEGLFTFHEWVKGCKRRASQVGYGFDEFLLEETLPNRLPKLLDARNIRGLIVASVLKDGVLPLEFSHLWNRFSCVVVGIPTTLPRLHVIRNDQYFTAYKAVQAVLALGYTRPALVVHPKIDALLDYRYSAGFRAALHDFPRDQIIPTFEFSNRTPKPFETWFQKHRPDVIITLHGAVREWLLSMNLHIPAEVGLVHLDLTPNLGGWSGMKQNNDLVGAAAVDMLIAQMNRNEFAPPAFSKCVLIESTWVPGATLIQRNTKSHPRSHYAIAARLKRDTRSF